MRVDQWSGDGLREPSMKQMRRVEVKFHEKGGLCGAVGVVR